MLLTWLRYAAALPDDAKPSPTLSAPAPKQTVRTTVKARQRHHTRPFSARSFPGFTPIEVRRHRGLRFAGRRSPLGHVRGAVPGHDLTEGALTRWARRSSASSRPGHAA